VDIVRDGDTVKFVSTHMPPACLTSCTLLTLA
jgi:hypothetical protein